MIRLMRAAPFALLLAACGPAVEESEPEPAAFRAPPSVEARAVLGFEDVGGDIVDIVLLPNAVPFLGRSIVAVDGGGLMSFDLASGASTPLDAPAVGSLAAAPEFFLRGSAAPLIFASGGELDEVRAWVYLAEEEALIDLPMEPIVPDGEIRALCDGRVTDAVADLVIATDQAIETWQVRDRGGDALSVERVSSVDTGEALTACDSYGGSVIGVWESSRSYEVGPTDPLWGVEGVTDASVVTRGDAKWVMLARPDARAGRLITPYNEAVQVEFVDGLNTPSTPAPARVASSATNFGGPFSQGVLAVAQDDRINFIELGGLLDRALAAVSAGG